MSTYLTFLTGLLGGSLGGAFVSSVFALYLEKKKANAARIAWIRDKRLDVFTAIIEEFILLRKTPKMSNGATRYLEPTLQLCERVKMLLPEKHELRKNLTTYAYNRAHYFGMVDCNNQSAWDAKFSGLGSFTQQQVFTEALRVRLWEDSEELAKQLTQILHDDLKI